MWIINILMSHIDFTFGEANISECVIFFKHVQKEFKLHK